MFRALIHLINTSSFPSYHILHPIMSFTLVRSFATTIIKSSEVLYNTPSCDDVRVRGFTKYPLGFLKKKKINKIRGFVSLCRCTTKFEHAFPFTQFICNRQQWLLFTQYFFHHPGMADLSQSVPSSVQLHVFVWLPCRVSKSICGSASF